MHKTLRRSLAVLAFGAPALVACGPNGGPRPLRVAIYEELKTVSLKNCDIKRIGSPNDGGYVMCANLMEGAKAGYSYGIAADDNWGCEISKKLKAPVHQYDCFTPHRPKCDGGQFVFHDECLSDKAETLDAAGKQKPFDTLVSQFKKNGDADKHIIIKIDVEGAEWNSILATPEDVLDRMDQLVMEFHGQGKPHFKPHYVDVLKKLKKQFHLVNVHYNNHACQAVYEPIPAGAWQALWVNKKIGELDPNTPGRRPGAPPDAPDATDSKDCQPETWP